MNQTLTEDQIERHVESEMDRLDRYYLNGKLSDEDYNAEVEALDQWAVEQHMKIALGARA